MTTPAYEQQVTLKNGRAAIIRDLRPGDTALLHACFCEYDTETRRNFAPHPFTREMAEDICSNIGKDETTRRFIIVDAAETQKPLGYAFLWHLHEETPSLGIGLTPEGTGHGLGRQMMNVLLDTACAMGYAAIWLSVMDRNTRAKGLYESLGFKYEGERFWDDNGDGWMWKMSSKLKNNPTR